MNLKIKEIFLDKNAFELRFLLDLDGQTVLAYRTKHGYQIPNLGTELTDEQIEKIYSFLDEFFQTVEGETEET